MGAFSKSVRLRICKIWYKLAPSPSRLRTIATSTYNGSDRPTARLTGSSRWLGYFLLSCGRGFGSEVGDALDGEIVETW